MSDNGRRIRSTSKPDHVRELKRDPARLLELAFIALGILVSAFSSYFAWQAADSSADQARYAREALTTADANETFRDYIATWNKLCRAITPPEYFITVGTPSLFEDGSLHVSVSNLGFDSALFDVGAYIDRVGAAEDAVKDAHLEFQTFIAEDVFARSEQAQTVTSFFYFSPDYLVEKDGILTQIVKASALCHYYTEEQLKWFKNRDHKIAPVINAILNMNIEYSFNYPAAPQR